MLPFVVDMRKSRADKVNCSKVVCSFSECPYYEVMQTDSLTKAKGKKFLLGK